MARYWTPFQMNLILDKPMRKSALMCLLWIAFQAHSQNVTLYGISPSYSQMGKFTGKLGYTINVMSAINAVSQTVEKKFFPAGHTHLLLHGLLVYQFNKNWSAGGAMPLEDILFSGFVKTKIVSSDKLRISTSRENLSSRTAANGPVSSRNGSILSEDWMHVGGGYNAGRTRAELGYCFQGLVRNKAQDYRFF